jgi:hypothetical protein
MSANLLLDENTKQFIDGMDYCQLLQRWRFAPVGDPLFQGDVGDYFKQVMNTKRADLADHEHVRISKDVGW